MIDVSKLTNRDVGREVVHSQGIYRESIGKIIGWKHNTSNNEQSTILVEYENREMLYTPVSGLEFKFTKSKTIVTRADLMDLD